MSKISKIEPWFNNSYILRLRAMDFQVPVIRSKVKEFRQLMRLYKRETVGHNIPVQNLQHLPQHLTQVRPGAQQPRLIVHD